MVDSNMTKVNGEASANQAVLRLSCNLEWYCEFCNFIDYSAWLSISLNSKAHCFYLSRVFHI